MRRFLMTSMLLLTLCNLGAAVIYACECTAKTGAKCSGTYCRTTADGNCQCQDKPFEKAALAEADAEMAAY